MQCIQVHTAVHVDPAKLLVDSNGNETCTPYTPRQCCYTGLHARRIRQPCLAMQSALIRCLAVCDDGKLAIPVGDNSGIEARTHTCILAYKVYARQYIIAPCTHTPRREHMCYMRCSIARQGR